MNRLRDHVPAGPDTGCPGYARRFDDWAASYDLSPLQTVLYGPVHDAVLRYARQHVRHPGMILDVGCGTGRLSARLASAYDQARVVGIDASTGMIRYAASTTVPRRSRFAAALAERLPFAGAVFDLVVVTLSVSHWRDRAAGLAEISRVMAPDGTLVAAGPSAPRSFPPRTRRIRRSTPWLHGELPALIAACGLQVERVEPIPSVAAIADTVMVAARTAPVRQPPGRRGAKPRPFGPYLLRDRNRARWPEDPAGRIRVVRSVLV
jgi:ubiquinone/menaquinone biosynthesis C-methylase UbiE